MRTDKKRVSLQTLGEMQSATDFTIRMRQGPQSVGGVLKESD